MGSLYPPSRTPLTAFRNGLRAQNLRGLLIIIPLTGKVNAVDNTPRSPTAPSGITMPDSIRLVREEPRTPFVNNRAHSERLRVTAVTLGEMSPKIFIHKAISGLQPEYVGVATPADYDALPFDAPDLDESPLYLLDRFDILLMDPQMSTDVWQATLAAAQRLIDARNRGSDVDVAETVIIGDAPADSLSN